MSNSLRFHFKTIFKRLLKYQTFRENLFLYQWIKKEKKFLEHKIPMLRTSHSIILGHNFDFSNLKILYTNKDLNLEKNINFRNNGNFKQ